MNSQSSSRPGLPPDQGTPPTTRPSSRLRAAFLRDCGTGVRRVNVTSCLTRPAGQSALYLLRAAAKWSVRRSGVGRGLRMSRQYDGWRRLSDARGRPPGAVAFIDRLTASPAFQDLFREGMGLVEEAAAYLDGPGRAESRALSRTAGLAYATESMRLTTRLMQVASWLLLQRAVNEGEMTPSQALTERHRVKLSRQDLACPPEIFEQLPETLRRLSRRSLRIQERVIYLDQSLICARAPEVLARGSVVAAQFERLRAAFSS